MPLGGYRGYRVNGLTKAAVELIILRMAAENSKSGRCRCTVVCSQTWAFVTTRDFVKSHRRIFSSRSTRECTALSLLPVVTNLFIPLLKTYIRHSSKGATSFPDRGSYEYDQIRVSLCLLCLI